MARETALFGQLGPRNISSLDVFGTVMNEVYRRLCRDDLTDGPRSHFEIAIRQRFGPMLRILRCEVIPRIFERQSRMTGGNEIVRHFASGIADVTADARTDSRHQIFRIAKAELFFHREIE